MAEPTPPPAPAADPTRGPVLPSTADEVPYVPVSWLAVGAAAVATAFALTLAAGAYVAKTERRPLLWEWLLLLPIGAVVLSFAARRVIRNAEGTRTGVAFGGVDLPNAAWWTSVVLGLGYAAYLFAINFSVGRDAQGEAEKWVASIQKGDLTRAFHRTRDPAERANTRADDAAALENRYRTEFVAFRQTDLVRLAARNPGRFEFAVGGMREWGLKTTGVDGVVAGTVSCPEGTFPVHLPLRGVEAGAGGVGVGGRQWQFNLPAAGAGYVQRDQARLTPYGWLVFNLEQDGAHAALQAVRDPTGAAARYAAVGVTAGMIWAPTPQFYKATADLLFRLPGGGDPPPAAKEKFLFAWGSYGVVPAGVRLRDSPDVNPLLSFTDAAVEVRLPVEIAVPSAKKDVLTARGRVVMACTDPAVVAEARQLREAADPARATATTDTPPRRFDWKLVRIESDMRGLAPKPTGPPGPGGMGGPDE